MTDSVATQTMLNGSKKVIMKFTNISDGTGESAVKKVDISAFSPVPSKFKIAKINYSTTGMAVQLLWDATANVLAHSLPADGAGIIDFRPFGGLQNNAGTGKTGDLLLTTVGHSAGDSYSIILELDKS